MSGPKRKQTDPTLVLDVEKELSEAARDAIGKAADSYPSIPPPDDMTILDPTPEERAEMLRVSRERQSITETLVECPVCDHCEGCGGTHMVSAARFAELRK